MNKPTKQMSVEELLTDFLGEHHKHLCPSGCITGCINCRGTGMNQTPCLLCDENGTAFKRRRDLEQALESLITERERLARADQIMLDFLSLNHGMDIDVEIDESKLIDWQERQIAELQPTKEADD